MKKILMGFCFIFVLSNADGVDPEPGPITADEYIKLALNLIKISAIKSEDQPFLTKENKKVIYHKDYMPEDFRKEYNKANDLCSGLYYLKYSSDDFHHRNIEGYRNLQALKDRFLSAARSVDKLYNRINLLPEDFEEEYAMLEFDFGGPVPIAQPPKYWKVVANLDNKRIDEVIPQLIAETNYSDKSSILEMAEEIASKISEKYLETNPLLYTAGIDDFILYRGPDDLYRRN